ncbi:MAG: hypothetical protein KDC35_14630 [Acidobacteria bacterium]|nr:hypothetical protein [Acidobacteriota bacterium]
MILVYATAFLMLQEGEAVPSRAHQNGPIVHEVSRLPDHNAFDIISKAFQAIGNQLIGDGYANKSLLEVHGLMDFDMPVQAIDQSAKSDAQVQFDVRLEGEITPNGMYRYQFQGGLGDIFMIRNQTIQATVSHEFKTYADQPLRTRNENANLQSFQSLILKKLGQVKSQILDSGHYRFVYGGTGYYAGRIVHVVRIFKPTYNQAPKKGPIPIQKLWTFWYDGGYEVWIYADNYLPAALFYTNIDDNIYANINIDYDREHLPRRMEIHNNSVGFDGAGELVLDFDAQRVLKSLRLRFDSQKGHDLMMDFDLTFSQNADPQRFKVLPPFGYRKVNRDHLKLLLTTKIAGEILNLKQHGVNIKNFKF